MDIKRCFKCGFAKPLCEFYPHGRMADGHLNKCKECTKRDVAEREARLKLDPAWLAKERARHREKFKRLGHTWHFTASDRAEYSEEWRRKHPDAVRAHNMIARAIKAGRLVRPTTCEWCGAKDDVEGHHEDYSKPLDVKWLCHACHGLTRRKDAA